MPETSTDDPLARRMTARRAAVTTPAEDLAVGIDYLRAAAKRVARHDDDPVASVSDLIVAFVAAQVWAAAALITPTAAGPVARLAGPAPIGERA